MQYPRKDLELIQKKYNFIRVDELEKVLRLTDLLEMVYEDKHLSKHFLLKGGTAINLLWLDLPRLSVDIDLNYIGIVNRNEMIEQKKKLLPRFRNIFKRQVYDITSRNESRHAGCNYDLRYKNTNNGRGKIKVDISFMHRTPIYGTTEKQPSILSEHNKEFKIQTLTIEELFAGKLNALCDRGTPRDYFDAFTLNSLKRTEIDKRKVKKAFIFLATINIKDFDRFSLDSISKIDQERINKELAPMLRKNSIPSADEILSSTNSLLKEMLNFNKQEKLFISTFFQKKKLIPEILFDSEKYKFLSEYPQATWSLVNLTRSN